MAYKIAKFLLFATALKYANAGVVSLQPYEEAQILQQFDQLCASGKVPETGQLLTLGGQQTWVYCKKEKGNHVRKFQHRTKYEGPAQHAQTVFIKPADYYINSDVVVDAILKSAGVNIHVVPPNINSDVSVTVRPDIQPPSKPRVAFLSGSKTGATNIDQTATGSGSRPFGSSQFGEQNLESFARSASAQVNVVHPQQQQQQQQQISAPVLPPNQQQAIQHQQQQQDQVRALAIPGILQNQQRVQRQVEAIPVTWEFLMNELRRNGNNKKAMYYVIRNQN